jgi:hypothetical protein
MRRRVADPAQIMSPRMYRLEDIREAITHKSALWLASHPGAERHAALERRRCEIGGMLELARRLDDHRLMRFLEAHKDALRRLIEAD